MEQEIRHRRLHAFMFSKVLNAMMTLVVVNLFLMAYTRSMLLPALCGLVALVFFIGYALWLWVKKPRVITLNRRMSVVSRFLLYYYLIVSAMKEPGSWWYIFPLVMAVVLTGVSLIDNRDEEFSIE